MLFLRKVVDDRRWKSRAGKPRTEGWVLVNKKRGGYRGGKRLGKAQLGDD